MLTPHFEMLVTFFSFTIFFLSAPSTVDLAAAAGANMIVAGSAIFKHASPREVMDQLRDNVQKHLDARR